jgi:MFS family permease
MEPSEAKQQKTSPLSIMAAIFASLSFSLIFFSSLGPISGSYIPFHPMGWAGMFVFLAMLCAYSYRYQQTKDEFWFILALMFFPVLLSDLYFFPIPPVLGLGMAEWMGVQSIITFICFTIVSKNKMLKYSNLGILLILPIAGAAYFFPKLGLSTFLMASGYFFGVVVSATLSYFAYKRKEYFLIVGAVLNFLVSMPIPMLYIADGYIPFGWNHEMMAVVTDRIAIFGRILMVVSWPALAAFWAKNRNLDKV